MEAISKTAAYADGKLAVLFNNDVDDNSTAARRKLRNRMAEEADRDLQGESFMSSMWKFRAARAGVAMLALVLITTAFIATPMRSMANDWFNRMQVEQFEAIVVQPEEFTEFQTELLLRGITADHQALMGAMKGLAEFETSIDESDLKSHVTMFDSVDDARAAYGEFKLPSNLPAGFTQVPTFMMTDSVSATATLDTASVHTIVDELGLTFDSLPSAADAPQMAFTIDVPSGLLTHYGAGIDQHLAIVQMPSPTLTTPESLDMDAFRDDVLALPGLPETFVDQVSAIEDWQNTLIVPVPEGASHRDVTVGGNAGLLLEAGEFDGKEWGMDFGLEGDVSVVMWNDDGILYIVAGSLNGDDLLEVAGSLR